MPSWKKVIISGSAAELSSVYAPSITGSLQGTASFAITSSYATTASYAVNGGVTQLLAGPNITLSPTTGLGQVTISSTGTGTYYNTSTGSYGSFYDTTTQTNPVANIPLSMSFDSTDITNGVSISGSASPFNTYIKTTNAGVYDIQFSAQVEKTDSGTDEITIWLRKNGIDITDSATKLTLSGNSTKVVAAWNWFVSSAANDYYQIIWVSADTGMRLYAEPINDTPGIPSVILTVNRVDQFLSNTGSFSGSFTGIFTGSLSGTSSYATQALSASFAPSSPAFPFTGSALITGSLGVTGSLTATSFTGSLLGTASYAAQALSASFALTSSAANVGDASDVNAQFHIAFVANTGSTQLIAADRDGLYNPKFNTLTVTSSFALTASYVSPSAIFPYTGSARITGSLGVTGSLSVIDGNGASILNTTSQTLYGSNNLSIEWGSRKLYDTSGAGFLSADWRNRLLHDTSTSQSLDWTNRKLYDNNITPLLSVDWRTRDLIDINESASLNWRTRLMRDSGAPGGTGVPVSSIDWETRQAYDSNGSASIDWTNRYLNDGVGNPSIEWIGRAQFDANGNNIIDYSGNTGYSIFNFRPTIESLEIGVQDDFTQNVDHQLKTYASRF
jgi:hypothetical protein